MDDFLIIDNKKFHSRLLTGTGRHKSAKELIQSIENSQTEIITVAIRRINLEAKKEENILEIIKSKKDFILHTKIRDSKSLIFLVLSVRCHIKI